MANAIQLLLSFAPPSSFRAFLPLEAIASINLIHSKNQKRKKTHLEGDRKKIGKKDRV